MSAPPVSAMPAAGAAQIGGSCDRELQKACSLDGIDKFVCTQGLWAFNGSCDHDDRCDPEAGATQGSCQARLPACMSLQPEAAFCEGSTRMRCSATLLHARADPCPANSYCDSERVEQCACDDGYRTEPNGACTPALCPPEACVGGSCRETVEAPGYACDCGLGTSGTGTTECVDVDECGQSNVCPAQYPCKNSAPGYSCRGQFADWEAPRVGVPRDYTVATDTVLDNATGLMWQRQLPLGANYPGCSGGEYNHATDSGTLGAERAGCTHAEALRYCESLSLGGFDDWRTPTFIELMTLVDYTKSRPAADMAVLPLSGVDWSLSPIVLFWTVSFSSDDPELSRNLGLGVSFADGRGQESTVTSGGWVRCVR